MSPAEQARVLLAMVLCGAALGAGYDALRLLGRALCGGRVVEGALDLVFGALCAAGIAAAALRLQVDAFRWYTLLGALLGMTLYRASVGMILRRMLAFGGRVRGKLIKMSRKRKIDAGKSVERKNSKHTISNLEEHGLGERTNEKEEKEGHDRYPARPSFYAAGVRPGGDDAGADRATAAHDGQP